MSRVSRGGTCRRHGDIVAHTRRPRRTGHTHRRAEGKHNCIEHQHSWATNRRVDAHARLASGPTAEENLVTLYGTCHKGLDPDFEPSVRELARLPGSAIILDSDSSEFRADVARYREFIARSTSDETVWA